MRPAVTACEQAGIDRAVDLANRIGRENYRVPGPDLQILPVDRHFQAAIQDRHYLFRIEPMDRAPGLPSFICTCHMESSELSPSVGEAWVVMTALGVSVLRLSDFLITTVMVLLWFIFRQCGCLNSTPGCLYCNHESNQGK